MKSMTGFAYAEKNDADVSVSVEIKSYNNRFLELSIVPPLSALEPRVRAIIGERCKRGKVEVGVRVKKQNVPFSVNVNTVAARAWANALTQIKELLPQHFSVEQNFSIRDFAMLEGIVTVEKNREDDDGIWDLIKDVFFEALDKFDAERVREGRDTKENILLHITKLEKSRDTIASFLPRVEQSIKDNIRNRFAELSNDSIDANRILAETAILLMKYTIAEELSRLSSHLAEFRAELAADACAGKKLDFICQEMNREVNTIGSKTPLIEVSREVIEMKDALENIREQLRNVE